jgi:hypothetical protein
MKNECKNEFTDLEWSNMAYDCYHDYRGEKPMVKRIGVETKDGWVSKCVIGCESDFNA